MSTSLLDTVPDLDIEIYKGEEWELDIVLTDDNDTPIPLTGYSAKAQIRDIRTNELLYTFESGTNITITPSEGRLVFSVSSADSALLGFMHGKWDCFIKTGTVRTPLWKGRVEAPDSCTQDA